MKRKIIALMLACAVVLGCTGCVKVIKIGEEGKYTGKAAFNAADAAADRLASASFSSTYLFNASRSLR